jgi:ribulose-5-phosphate 4-epimerase/fuculose-1-phosphate aldolase
VLRDGVIQFEAVHTHQALEVALHDVARSISGWRAVLVRLGLVGEDPARYEGVAFGNVSVRVPPFRGPRGQQSAFVVTGTQTGGKGSLGLDDLAVVDAWDLAKNRVHSRGRTLPSSESLTHGAIYGAVPGARAVVHVHAPTIFARAAALSLPSTRPDVGYGTRAMAAEVARLWESTHLRTERVLVMTGHEDGVISFGTDLDDAGARLLRVLARAEACALA